jgi:hypothetical protein
LRKFLKNQPKNFQEEILKGCFPKENYKIGDFVNVKLTQTSGTLKGQAVGLSEMN